MLDDQDRGKEFWNWLHFASALSSCGPIAFVLAAAAGAAAIAGALLTLFVLWLLS